MKKIQILLFISCLLASVIAQTNLDDDTDRRGFDITDGDYNSHGAKHRMESMLDGEFFIDLECGDNTGGVDIVFAIDNTGSMGTTIYDVQANINGLTSELDARGYDYRFGGICYGDVVGPGMDAAGYREAYDSAGAIIDLQMTSDYWGSFRPWIDAITAFGGGDSPENALCTIEAAMNNYNWRPEAINIIIFFTDATFYETGDACDGSCDYTRPEVYTDIIDGGFIVFASTSSSPYDGTCSAVTSAEALAWYQNTTVVSGGNWYDLSTSWVDIFDDVITLIDTFEFINFCVTNNTGATVDLGTAEITPGSCIELVSPNPQTYGPWAESEEHCFLWQINSDTSCTTGSETCFTVTISGGGFADSALGCIYLPDCMCPGPIVSPICPPCYTASACPYQEITILVSDEGRPINTSSIILEVDGDLYYFPDHMTFANDTLTFIPDTPWEHNYTVVVYLQSAEDSMGCNLQNEIDCRFILDLEPPEIVNISPPCGSILNDTFSISIELHDIPTGIDSADLFFIVDGTPYPIGGGNVEYEGDLNHGFATFSATLTELGIFPGDSFELCIDVEDMVSEWEENCYLCGPNDTEFCCYYRSFSCEGPIASPVCPPCYSGDSTVITACADGQITIAIIDEEYQLDESSIILDVNGSLYSFPDHLNFENDTLVFTPDPFWEHGDTISYTLLEADNIMGCELQDVLTCKFIVDLQPPTISSISPPCDTEQGETISFSVELHDTPAGINISDFFFTVDGQPFYLDEGYVAFDGNSTHGTANLSGGYSELGVIPGDTMILCIDIEDLVSGSEDGCVLCGPNDTIFCCSYFYFPPTGCNALPNPFTPNDDGFNDYAQFTYPDMFRENGDIYIFNLHSVELKHLQIEPGRNCKIASRWDGTDKNNRSLSNGVYIYVIEVNGEIVCEGTITIAR